MKLTDQQLEQAARQVVNTIGNAPFSQENQTFPPEFEEKMAHMLKKQRQRKHLLTFARSVAAVLLAVIMLCGAVLTFDAEARAEILYHWQRLSPHMDNYQFYGVEVQTPLTEYMLTAVDYTCTFCAEEDNYRLQMYQNDDTIVFLKYCRMVSSENFSITSSFDDRNAISATVTVNGMEAHLYRPGAAVRPSKLVWLDTDSGIAFILFGVLGSDDLIALAESVRPVRN